MVKKLNKEISTELLSCLFRDYCYSEEILVPTHADWVAFLKEQEYYAMRFANYSWEHEVSKGDHADWVEFMKDPSYYDSMVADD